MTTFERSARMRKANALATAVQSTGASLGHDLVAALDGLDDNGWRAAAALAGVRPPGSAHTRHLAAGIVRHRLGSAA